MLEIVQRANFVKATGIAAVVADRRNAEREAIRVHRNQNAGRRQIERVGAGEPGDAGGVFVVGALDQALGVIGRGTGSTGGLAGKFARPRADAARHENHGF
jgi:hypothetical protein